MLNNWLLNFVKDVEENIEPFYADSYIHDWKPQFF